MARLAVVALAVALCVGLPTFTQASSSASCTCSGTPFSAPFCTAFASTCASQISGGVSSCTVGVANPICTASGFSGSCPDTNTANTQCSAACLVLTGGTGTWTCSTGSSSSCFPANATVELESGLTKTMNMLTIGDKVRVNSNTFSDVYMFSHRLSAIRAEFVRIATSTNTIMLTPNHYLYVNGKLAIASTVKVGDQLTTRSGLSTVVTSVSTAWAEGLYNPHTMDGDIVVDGILTSTYTSDISPSLAHAALWPVRMLHTLGQDVVGHAFDSGSELLASILPDGKARY